MGGFGGLHGGQGVGVVAGFQRQHLDPQAVLRGALAEAPRLVHRAEDENHRRKKQGGHQQPLGGDVQAEEKVHLAVAHRAKGQGDKAHAPQKGGGPPVAKVVEGPVEAQPHQGRQGQLGRQREHRREGPRHREGHGTQHRRQEGLQVEVAGQGQQHQVELLQGVVPGEEQRGPKEHQGPGGHRPRGPCQPGGNPPHPQGEQVGSPIAGHSGPQSEAVLQQGEKQPRRAQQCNG